MANQFSGLISNQDSGRTKDWPPHLPQKADDFLTGTIGQQASHLKTGCPINHMNHIVFALMGIENELDHLCLEALEVMPDAWTLEGAVRHTGHIGVLWQRQPLQLGLQLKPRL